MRHVSEMSSIKSEKEQQFSLCVDDINQTSDLLDRKITIFNAFGWGSLFSFFPILL